MRRVRDLRIQVAPLIVSPILSRSKISRRGLARALLPSVVPELPIRRLIFAPEGCLSQVAGAVTGSLVSTNILLASADSIINCNIVVIFQTFLCVSVFETYSLLQVMLTLERYAKFGFIII